MERKLVCFWEFTIQMTFGLVQTIHVPSRQVANRLAPAHCTSIGNYMVVRQTSEDNLMEDRHLLKSSKVKAGLIFIFRMNKPVKDFDF